MRMTASWSKPGLSGNHRIQGCGARFALPTAGSPQINGRTPALPRARTIGSDHHQRDTVLATVKAWPGDARACRTAGATAILDGVCARCHCPRAGRDEETALTSNKETGQARKEEKIPSSTQRFLTMTPIQGWAKAAESLQWGTMRIPPCPRGYSCQIVLAARPRGHGGSGAAPSRITGAAFAHPTTHDASI